MVGSRFSAWRSDRIGGLTPPLEQPVATTSPGHPPTLLLFGDSRIDQWSPLPPRPYRIETAGFPGETAIRLSGRLGGELARTRPTKVLLQAGINDAVAAALVGPQRRHQALQDSLAAFERMAIDVHDSGADLIVLRIPPPIRPGLLRRVVYRHHVDSYVESLNNALPAIAARHGAKLVDPMPLLAADGHVPDRYRRDALHFTPDAYQALAPLLPPTIESRR